MDWLQPNVIIWNLEHKLKVCHSQITAVGLYKAMELSEFLMLSLLTVSSGAFRDFLQIIFNFQNIFNFHDFIRFAHFPWLFDDKIFLHAFPWLSEPCE